MTAPLVSVCIPTYNGARFLGTTIESVLNQTYGSIEVIVSDDASTDSTLDIIDRMKDDRFTVLHHSGANGAEGNWNASCAPARGRYLKLLCQDDILHPRCLEVQVEALESDARAAFVWSPRDVISPRGRRLMRGRGYRPTTPFVTMADVARDMVRSGTNPFGEPCAVLMRKSAFDATDGFHGKYVIDLNMWIDLLRQSGAVFVDETLSQFRVSNTSWTSELRGEHSGQVNELMESVAREFPSLVSADDLAVGGRNSSRLQRRRSLVIALTKALAI